MRRIVHVLIAGAILLLVTNTFWVLGLIPLVTVSGDSMAPTFRDGQRVWINRLGTSRADLTRGDIIALRDPTDARRWCVKRIVGLPGEVVELGPQFNWPNNRQWRVGDDELFVVGDNHPNSLDSRRWPHAGVPFKLVLGKVWNSRSQFKSPQRKLGEK